MVEAVKSKEGDFPGGFIYRGDCPVCGSGRNRDYLDIPADKGDVEKYILSHYNLFKKNKIGSLPEWTKNSRYVLAECSSCRCTFQRYALGEGHSQELYSCWIEHKPLTIPLEEADHNSREALRLAKLASGSTGKASLSDLKVLDYGMGRGRQALAFRGCGCQVYGYDFAEVRQTEENFGIRIVSREAISDHRFDLVHTEQVFEHLPDPLETARMLAGVLRPGGLLKISVPFNRTLERGDKRIVWTAARYGRHSPMPNSPYEHLQYYRRPSLDILGKKLGLERVHVPRADYIAYGKNWLGTGLLKNIGNAFVRDWFRNYYIFRKPAP